MYGTGKSLMLSMALPFLVVVCVFWGVAATATAGDGLEAQPRQQAVRGTQPATNPQVIAPAEAWRRIQLGERITIVDVRDDLDRSVDGHIAGDVNIPYQPQEQFAENFQRAIPDKTTTLFFYCKSGGTGGYSHKVATAAASLGYTNTYYLAGGLIAWPYATER